MQRRIRLLAVLVAILLGEDCGFGARLLDADAGVQASGDAQIPDAALPQFGRQPAQLDRHWQEGLDPADVRRRQVVHDADHRVRPGVERERAADGVRIRQQPVHPELTSDDDDGDAILFAAQKRAARDRRHAQDVEVVVGDDRGDDVLRLITDTCHRDRQTAVGGERDRAALRAPQVLELRHRCGQPLLTAVSRLAPKPDQRVGVRVGQPAHEQAVDQREDRRVRADAERQRDDGHRREAGILGQHPAGIPRVLSEGVHQADCLGLRLYLTNPRTRKRGPQRNPVAFREHHDGAPEKSRAGSPFGAQIFQ